MLAKYLPILLAVFFIVLYLIIVPPVKPPEPVCEITTASLPQGTVGQDYSATLAANCDPPPLKWSAPPGDLPPGLSLSEDGKISGKPEAAAAGRTFSFEVTVTNSATPPQSAKKTFQITIGGVPRCTITPAQLPNGTEDRPYPAQTLRTTNCTPPLTWAVSAGALPPGLTLNPTTGVIAGTPTEDGTFNFTVRVTDSASPAQSDTEGFRITIGDEPLPCTITPAQLPNGTEDRPYPAQTLRTTNCPPPLTWAVSAGALPPGLTLNPTTGVIAGTPTEDGTFNFTVRVTDSASPAQSDTEGFRIVIEPVELPRTILINGRDDDGLRWTFKIGNQPTQDGGRGSVADITGVRPGDIIEWRSEVGEHGVTFTRFSAEDVQDFLSLDRPLEAKPTSDLGVAFGPDARGTDSVEVDDGDDPVLLLRATVREGGPPRITFTCTFHGPGVMNGSLAK